MDGSENEWPTSRLQALAYTIGVVLKGDGSVYRTNEYQHRNGKTFTYVAHRICLKNKSIRFMNEFNHKLAVTLQRQELRIQGPNYEGHFILQSRSKSFVLWWDTQSLNTLRPVIERFPTEYLRGRFDSDGNVHKYAIYLHGAESHREILEFDRLLCSRIGIRIGKLGPYGKPGEIFYYRGKKIQSRQQKLRFSVNSSDYLRTVGGFNVEWRDRELRTTIKGRNWTAWPAEIKNRARFLRCSTHWNCKKVATELSKEFGISIPYTTVYFWLRRGERD